ncbi:MAG: four-helix bundle copper-binding protein, partial [Chitinophagaceae bacterium]
MVGTYQQFQSCIDACLRCASACQHCASSCTQEEDVKMMARCIQLDMECAAICYAA